MTEQSFIRNNFFTGKMLTVEALELEQNYFRSKLKLHNRSLHGFGIVTGLEVDLLPRRNELRVTPGLALDCAGNEILIPHLLLHSLPEHTPDSSVFLSLHYHETKTDPTAALGSNDLCEFTHIAETFILRFESQNPHQGHRHVRGRWQACGEPHGLAIARLRRGAGQWRLDRRLRRLSVK
jgi:hypothetical protein